MRVEMSFVVPGEPVPKGRARVFKNNGITHGVTPKRTVNFEALVKLMAASARPTGWPMRCEYAVHIHAVRARRRRGDNSNLAKGIEDACNTVVWADDEQVCDLHVTRALEPDNARTEVTIVAQPVVCTVASCGAETFFPVENRCEACAAMLEAKRAARALPKPPPAKRTKRKS